MSIGLQGFEDSSVDSEGGGGRAGGANPPEKSPKYRVLYQYWSGSPEKSYSYQSEFEVGPSLVRQRTPFKWSFAGGPIMTRS